jgi:hypothetical protein
MNLLTVFRSRFSQSDKLRAEKVAQRELARRVAFAQRPQLAEETLDLPSVKDIQVLEFGTFGDLIYVIGDKRKAFMRAEYRSFIAFARPGDTALISGTDLLPCRAILGAAAYLNERRVFVANRDFPDCENKTVNIFVYHVQEDLSCILRHTCTFTAANCAGTAFMGRLCSADAHNHVVAYGDLSNNSYYRFGTATVTQVGAPIQKVERRSPPDCMFLDDLYIMPDGSYYTATAHAVGNNMIALLVDADRDKIAVFERVVVLPFEHGVAPDQYVNCNIVSHRRLTTPTSVAERLLICVTLHWRAENRLLSRFVALLLNIPTNEVLQMHVLSGSFDKCALSADATQILHLQQEIDPWP